MPVGLIAGSTCLGLYVEMKDIILVVMSSQMVELKSCNVRF
jgi:hypothetical protein